LFADADVTTAADFDNQSVSSQQRKTPLTCSLSVRLSINLSTIRE